MKGVGQHFSSEFESIFWEFPDGLVVKTPAFHCRGYGFDPWFSRLEKFHMPNSEAKKSKREREKEC